MKKRQLLALAGGTISGFFAGELFGLDKAPHIHLFHGNFLQKEFLVCLLLGAVAGTVTPLLSWKHSPGLPAMAFSLIISCFGLTAAGNDFETIGEMDRMISYVFDSLVILMGYLTTYIFAWITDTQVVFRSLPVRPEAKKANLRETLIKMIPCSILTTLGGVIVGFIMPVCGAISISVSFALASFFSSYVFRVRSTLWYSLSGPFYLSIAGSLAFSRADLLSLFFSANWFQNYPAYLVCGAGSSGAILGHWIWLMKQR